MEEFLLSQQRGKDVSSEVGRGCVGQREDCRGRGANTPVVGRENGPTDEKHHAHCARWGPPEICGHDLLHETGEYTVFFLIWSHLSEDQRWGPLDLLKVGVLPLVLDGG